MSYLKNMVWVIFIAICATLIGTPASFVQGGSVHVKGYYRKDGTYVQPHYRSAPNGSKLDNWSTKGNVNPYTGIPGTKKIIPDSPITPVPAAGSRIPSEPAASNVVSGDDAQRSRSDCSHSIGTSNEKWCIEKRIEAIKEISKLKGDTNFSDAYADCKHSRGSTNEAWCIRKRIESIRAITALKDDPNFKAAYNDCSYSRGSTNEDWCIKKRIESIQVLASIQQHRFYKTAYSDCSHSRGSTNEEWCVKKRIEVLEAIEAMKGKPGFDAAWKSCSHSRGSTNEDYCIRKAIEIPVSGVSRAAPAQRSSTTERCESGNWVVSVSSDGEIVKLSDGSVWEIMAGDSVNSSLWLPIDDIVICDGKLINTDNGDKVDATQIK